MPLIASGKSGGDRTRAALAAWAATVPAASYLVAAIPAEGVAGPIHRRLLTPDQLDGALPWLKAKNSNGMHIVGRPWAPRHVLVDDLDEGTLEKFMSVHRPAAVVRTSPGSFQAWLSIAPGLLDPPLAGAVARLLAARFGGDPGAANAVQPGRIPGFTNRKVKHAVGGKYPYALLDLAAGPRLDPGGPALLAKAAEALACAQSAPKPGWPTGLESGGLTLRSPAGEYAEGARWVQARLAPGEKLDRSRVDFAIARRLLTRGMPAAAVVLVVLAGSKALGKGAAEAYARRTVEAALARVRGG